MGLFLTATAFVGAFTSDSLSRQSHWAYCKILRRLLSLRAFSVGRSQYKQQRRAVEKRVLCMQHSNSRIVNSCIPLSTCDGYSPRIEQSEVALPRVRRSRFVYQQQQEQQHALHEVNLQFTTRFLASPQRTLASVWNNNDHGTITVTSGNRQGKIGHGGHTGLAGLDGIAPRRVRRRGEPHAAGTRSAG
jgi:hypothetical protein